MREPIEAIKLAVQQIIQTAKQALRSAAQHVAEAWHAHRQRLAEDPAYGAAFAGVVVAACDLLTHDPRLLAVIAASTTAYITISRAASTGTWDNGGDWPWEF